MKVSADEIKGLKFEGGIPIEEAGQALSNFESSENEDYDNDVDSDMDNVLPSFTEGEGAPEANAGLARAANELKKVAPSSFTKYLVVIATVLGVLGEVGINVKEMGKTAAESASGWSVQYIVVSVVCLGLIALGFWKWHKSSERALELNKHNLKK